MRENLPFVTTTIWPPAGAEVIFDRRHFYHVSTGDLFLGGHLVTRSSEGCTVQNEKITFS